jgi:SAM-dependent methyltransferase
MRSNIEWRTWGRVDPLYGVVTIPDRGKTDINPWTDAEFYAHGADEWHHLLPEWRTFGVDTTSCLEIGCGAGRITQQLVQTFDRVYALDVSPDMVEYARAHVTPAERIAYFVTEGIEIPLPDQAVTAVLSLHVFQHFDSVADSLAYWREIYRVLRPGGTLFIQLPIHNWPWAPSIFDSVYRARRIVGSAIASVKRLMMQRGSERLFLRVVSYDANWLLRTLESVGYAKTELRCVSRPDSTCYWAVFAARP